MKIPFHKPNVPDSFDQIYTNSIRSGWLTSGSQVQIFEKNLSHLLEAEHIIAVNSCTAALHLALAAQDFKKGDEFIAPTYTFASTVECGIYSSMNPVLVDCDNSGFLLDLNEVEDNLKKNKKIRVIVPVHFGGETVDMKYLFELANKYGVFILEDAAHATEAISTNGKVGKTNFAAAFSFYANKNMTTGGEGGALATNDSKLAEKVKKLSLHGITKDGWERFKSHGKWEYDIDRLGYKYNLTDIAAAFGNWQIDQLEVWRNRRLDIIKKYLIGLDSIEGVKLPNFNKGHALHLFVLQLETKRWSISRNEFIKKMNLAGIGLAVHYKPIHLLSFYNKNYDLNKSLFPRANSLFNSVVSLPLYPNLNDDEVDYIISCIKQLFDKYSI